MILDKVMTLLKNGVNGNEEVILEDMDYNPVKQTKMVFIYIFMIIGLPANFIVLYVSFTGLQNFDFYQTFF